MDYPQSTHDLIERMERANLANPQPFDKMKIEEALTKAYAAADLDMPTIVFVTDIADTRLLRAASAARAASATRVALCASDYDFDLFVQTHASANTDGNKANEKDNKASAIWSRFLEAREAGLGYLAEKDGVLYCAPAPTVRVDEENKWHSDEFAAISWKDGIQLYFLHGVLFPKELWKKVVSGEMPFQDILHIEDVDQRAQAMRYASPWDFVKYAGGKELDTHTKHGKDGRAVRYWLYEFPADHVPEDRERPLFQKTAYFAIYDDSMLGAAKQHMQGVVPAQTVAEAMGWKQQITAEQWLGLELDVHFT